MQELQPNPVKNSPYGVSLNPNDPSKLPGPLRLATAAQVLLRGLHGTWPEHDL